MLETKDMRLNNIVPPSSYLKPRGGQMSISMFMINSLSSGYESWKRLSFTVFEVRHSGPRRSALLLEAGRYSRAGVLAQSIRTLSLETNTLSRPLSKRKWQAALKLLSKGSCEENPKPTFNNPNNVRR